MRWIALLLVLPALLLAVACEEEAAPKSPATTQAEATGAPVSPAPEESSHATSTPESAPTKAPAPTSTPAPPPPTPKPPPPPPTKTPVPPPPPQNCHPSYEGACLDPNCSDYDCAGGSGDGPCYTGRVRVVGPDVFRLDRDGDGWGCE